MDSKQYIEVLRDGGYRITEQRRLVCGYLARTRSHPTPSEVFDAISRQHPDISRATVYNTLNVLRDLGAIVEISVGGEHTHYDTDPTPHVNLVCLRCERVVDYQDDLPVDSLYKTVYHRTGFQPVSMQIQMVGFCDQCRTRKRNEIRDQLAARR